MKTVYTFIAVALLAISNLSAQVMWDDFESNRNVNYNFYNGVFIPYAGNDVAGGTNTSAVAASYERNGSELFDVISIEGEMANLVSYRTGTKFITMDVYSPAVGITVQITLENSAQALPANYPTGRYAEFQAATTVANQWETLTFGFINNPDPAADPNACDRLVVLFAPNTNTSGSYRWDNLMGPEFDNPPCDSVTNNPNIFNDFECNQNINFTFSHSGLNFQRVANPVANGVNTSDNVATYTRNAGELNDVIIASFGGTIPAPPANSVISMDVLDSLGQTPIKIALQNAAGDDIDTVVATTGSGTDWATVDFPITTTSSDISRLVILFYPNSNTSDKFYFDNIRANFSTAVEEGKVVESLSVYPNPTSSSVAISYSLLTSTEVEILIKDVTGKNVATIANDFQTSGNHTSVWNTSDASNGIYFYTIRTKKGTESGKIVVNK